MEKDRPEDFANVAQHFWRPLLFVEYYLADDRFNSFIFEGPTINESIDDGVCEILVRSVWGWASLVINLRLLCSMPVPPLCGMRTWLILSRRTWLILTENVWTWSLL